VTLLPVSQPHHHPTPETLTAFAAGTLRAGFDLVAAAHVRQCAECQAQLVALEHVGGALLAETTPAALDDDALTRTLARLDAPHAHAPVRTIEAMLAAAKRRWVAPGIWVAQVDTPHAPDDRVYLLSAAPGMATAKHSHSGAEFTLVLSGALSDGDVVYRAGDFTERDESHTHHPNAHGDVPCVCLFATQGRLAAAGWLGRLAFALANV
jgi:putative transcriptional regulator